MLLSYIPPGGQLGWFLPTSAHVSSRYVKLHNATSLPLRPQHNGCLYNAAAANNDLAMLRCLRRLGCPWGPDRGTFTNLAWCEYEFPVLRWLVEAGYPVDWDAAVKAAGQRTEVDRHEVLVWLAAERKQRLGTSQ